MDVGTPTNSAMDDDDENADTLLPEVEDRLVRTHSARGSQNYRRKVSNWKENHFDETNTLF